MVERSNEELLADLGVDVKQDVKPATTSVEERILVGFEEIQRFVDEHGRKPRHGEDIEIFERVFAIRLDRLRKLKAYFNVLKPRDYQNLLSDDEHIAEPSAEYKSDEELLSELGIRADNDTDITCLKHVKSRAERRVAEEIATRSPCTDFELFQPIFDQAQADLQAGKRETIPFIKNGSIDKGDLFILTGQKAYIADVGSEFKGKDGRKEYRLRVIFDNGVESDQLMRSFQKRLWEDNSGRRIVYSDIEKLFDDGIESTDSESGTIYVLRSKSEMPLIKENSNVIHKVGVTGGSIKQRIASAPLDPTFLMADVEIVASYELFNINRNKLEKLLHRVLESARLDIEINDRFGKPVKPKEWFLVPLFIIDEIVEKIKDGSLTAYRYDKEAAKLTKDL